MFIVVSPILGPFGFIADAVIAVIGFVIVGMGGMPKMLGGLGGGLFGGKT